MQMAEEKKEPKYNCLTKNFPFMLVAIETLGAIGLKNLAFLKDIGWLKKEHSGEEKAHQFLLQQLSVAGCTEGQCHRSHGEHSGGREGSPISPPATLSGWLYRGAMPSQPWSYFIIIIIYFFIIIIIIYY